MISQREPREDGEGGSAARTPPADHGKMEDALRRELDLLQDEEARLFDFLHELVERTANGRSTRRLPEVIVGGVIKVLGTASAAVYLLDRTGTQLVPAAVGAGFPPLVDLSAELQRETDWNAAGMVSYLKLKAAPLAQGVLGECLRGGQPCVLTHSGPPVSPPAPAPVMAAPLNFGAKALGLLVVAQGPGGEPFSAHSFSVFCGVAEQSAFALGHAMLQEEAAEKRRMENELRAASEIQRVLLPDKSPDVSGYSVAARNVAARVVSGDYYDFVQVDDSRTGVVIADVSGKGIPASLVMTTLRGLLRGMASGVTSPAQALGRVNRMLYHDVKEDMFVSVAYLMLERDTNSVWLARAGHDAPMLFSRKEGTVARLEPPGIAMGVDDGEVFDRVTRDYPFVMEPGDCLLLFTDGVNEAENAEGSEFGLAALEQTFRAAAPYGATAVLTAIESALAAHMAGAPQHDDITLIVIQRNDAAPV